MIFQIINRFYCLFTLILYWRRMDQHPFLPADEHVYLRYIYEMMIGAGDGV